MTSSVAKIKALAASDAFKQATGNISAWRAKIRALDAKDLPSLQIEIFGYFGAMKRNSPELYSYFESSEKSLIAQIEKKTTGRDAIIY